ncbi:hypothetical protein [Streptomyces cucumeris]|uniref:hypothetical protein n=1 Tax=Streptomyces cucumeris TaxID=2962890 RepID=UPI0020C8548D|nr:hypothetical protein [Streptomyces sp. NEAU-Y11]MCP9209286.1 hypothetical protein [Streptomyces sp. NEAU-Y11]
MSQKQTATNVRTGERTESEVPTADEAYVSALLREREGYATYGREDRVQAVDEELKRLGVTRADAHKGTERAVTKPRERRGTSR